MNRRRTAAVSTTLLAAALMVGPAMPAQAATCAPEKGIEATYGYMWDKNGACGTVGVRLLVSPTPTIETWTNWTYDPTFAKQYTKLHIVRGAYYHSAG